MNKRLKITRTGAYYLSYITIGFATGILGPALPKLSQNTGTDLGGISYLFPVLSIGYLIGSYIGGNLYDRFKTHIIYAVAILILAGIMLLIPSSPLLWLLLIFFLISGTASGTIDVGGNALLTWTHGDKVDPFMIGLHFFYGLGAFIAPMVVARSLRITADITWAYIILAIISVPIILFLLLTPSVKPPRRTAEQESESGSKGTVFLIALFMFMHVGAELSFGSWIYSYSLRTALMNQTNAAYVSSAYWGAIMVGRLISVAVSIKVSPGKMLMIYLLGAIAVVAVMLFAPVSAGVVWFSSIALGLFLSTLVPSTFSLTGKRMHLSGKLTGWLVIGIASGNLIIPWVVGQLFESVGGIILPIINMISLLIALVLLLTIFRLMKRTERS